MRRNPAASPDPSRPFRNKGYALTRLTDIAKRARAQTSSIYYYFESREAIVVEVLRIANDRTLQRVNDFLAELPPDATVQDKVTAVIRGHYDIVLSQDPYTMAHMRIFDQVPPQIKTQFLDVLNETAEIWRQLLGVGLSLVRDAIAMRESQTQGLAVADRVAIACELQFVCLSARVSEPAIAVALEALDRVWTA